jgi:hypothetical protein
VGLWVVNEVTEKCLYLGGVWVVGLVAEMVG